MSNSSRSSSPEIDLPQSLVAGRQRRSNAGNRLRTLLDAEDVSHLPSLVTPDGEVLDESLLFGEDANDVEFASDMDVQEDVVESDFDDDDEDEVEDEEAVEKALIEEEKQQRRAAKRKATEAFIKPKKKAEPVKRRPGRPTKAEQAAAAALETNTKTTTRRPTLLTSGSRRSARSTTAAVSTAVSAKLLALQARRARLPIQSRRSPTPELTQSERLAEAAITEEKNRASLGEWLRIEEERRRKREEMGRGQKRVLGAFIRVWKGGVKVDGFGKLVEVVTSERKKENEKQREGAEAQKSKDTKKVTDPDATEDAAPPDSEMLDAPPVAEKTTEAAAPSQSDKTATEVAIPAGLISISSAGAKAVQMPPPTVPATTPAVPSSATVAPAAPAPAPATPTAQAQAPQQPCVQATITPTSAPSAPTPQSQMPPPAIPAPVPATPAVAAHIPGGSGTPAPQLQPPTPAPPAHPPQQQAMWAPAPPGTPGAPAPPMQYPGWPPIPPCPPGVDPQQHHAYYVHYYAYAYPYHYPYHYPPPPQPQQAAANAAPGQVVQGGPSKAAVPVPPPPAAIDEEAERAKKKRGERHDSTRTLIQLLDFPDAKPDAGSILLSISSTSPSPYPTKKMCPITGLDARYVDPGTGVPYRDVAAYRVLQAVKEGRGGWCKGIGAFTGGGRVAEGVPEGFE
ncbi:hypothetical protein YB2330_001505 [Saitoella coloradoensis]